MSVAEPPTTPEPGVGSCSRRALRALGINTEAPFTEYRRAYERFLPVVEAGIYDALRRHDVRDAEGELRWLAEHLVIAPPASPEDRWWWTVWSEALEALPEGRRTFRGLGYEARTLLVRQLARSGSPDALPHALARAMASDG